MQRIFNFSAGPSMLPFPVLYKLQQELCDWNNSGVSIMEISHRSSEFIELAKNAQKDLKILLNIPNNYTILFCHGGARAQFSAIPMNLLKKSTDSIDYINTGYWGYKAAIESKKYCNPNIINISNNDQYNAIKPMSQWDLSEKSTYVHYCPNETIHGLSIDEDPIFYKDKIVVADCSSTLLSRPLNVNCFGMIYASAQKNIGISGLTVLIIRNDLIYTDAFYKKIPAILDYQVLSNNNSMFNTPVTISWYIASLIFKWLQDQGGLKNIHVLNQEKSDALYNAIDTNDFYYNTVNLKNRSNMNITFFLKNEELNNCFLQESKAFGLYGLKGHRALGGMRASLYNAMPLEGVKKLIKFMHFFSKRYA